MIEHNKTAIKQGKVAIKDSKVAIKDIEVAIKSVETAMNDARVAIKETNVAIRSEEQKKKIIDFADSNDSFKSADIELLLNLRTSRVKVILSSMVKEGSLKTTGKNKSTRYQLIKK